MAIPRINYSFYNFEEIAEGILDNPTPNEFRDLRNELNKFFKDATCVDIIYTKNTDKLFFGMCVIPTIDDVTVDKIVSTSDPVRFDRYYIEIDSKLLSPDLDILPGEFVAMLLHEVGHVINDTKPVETVRKSIDYYMMTNKESLIISNSMQYREILRYGILDTIHKTTSMFGCKPDEELMADEFAVACGYGEELSNALTKIYRKGYIVNKDVKNKLVVLSWCLRLYKEVRVKRIPALKTLQRGQELTASKLEIKQMKATADALKRIDDTTIMEGRLIDGIKEKLDLNRKAVAYKGIKGFEDDLYEYNLRVKHLYDEDDALLLLRELNTKISIIDDFVSNEKLSAREQEKWFNILDKYHKVRDELSKKSYSKFDYRAPIIQVNYPDIVANRA